MNGNFTTNSFAIYIQKKIEYLGDLVVRIIQNQIIFRIFFFILLIWYLLSIWINVSSVDFKLLLWQCLNTYIDPKTVIAQQKSFWVLFFYVIRFSYCQIIVMTVFECKWDYHWYEAGRIYPPIGFCQINFYQEFPNIFGGENWDQFDTLPSSLSLIKLAPRCR